MVGDLGGGRQSASFVQEVLLPGCQLLGQSCAQSGTVGTDVAAACCCIDPEAGGGPPGAAAVLGYY